ncbi:hypothetical protein niasHT_010117 [Heterodera trifolii]|uniref:Uncharacterized protein n=1 Tax=Heterodera trifolii TaxID=157864 RepID=A0ABD2LWL1_9BILA
MDVLEQVLAEIDKRLSVLSVDKSLDALREWGRINGINDNTNPNKRDCGLDLKRQLLFRNGRVKLTEHAFTCALMLNTKEFFEIQFCSANMEMPTECFSIVNLVDRDQPLVHRTVQLEDPNRIMDRFYNRTISGPPTLAILSMTKDNWHNDPILLHRRRSFGSARIPPRSIALVAAFLLEALVLIAITMTILTLHESPSPYDSNQRAGFYVAVKCSKFKN